MLTIGHEASKNCQSLHRRPLLQAGAISALGLSWPALLQQQAQAQLEGATAKSVILLWLWGGPSHLDTFDMKPEAPQEYRGPFSPIASSLPGLDVCELLPHLAELATEYTVIRSLNHDSNDHGISGTIGLTGSDSGAISLGGQIFPGRVQPTMGAVVSRTIEKQTDLPNFVALGGNLHQGHRPIAGEGGGTFGTQFDPFRLDYDPVQGIKLPEFDLLEGLNPQILEARRSLLTEFDLRLARAERSRNMEKFDQFYSRAFSMLTTSAAREVFDVTREPESLRRKYGKFRFGQCCLLARRLVESGVPFVQVNWSSHVEPIEDAGDGGWDMHDRNFIQMQDRHTWMLDQAMSALLTDLKERGLLNETIVIAMGEFGRTPKINNKAGRDHWQQCYSGVVAGGGFPLGSVIGASDKLGEYPAKTPVTPARLASSVYRRLGITTSILTQYSLVPSESIEELD